MRNLLLTLFVLLLGGSVSAQITSADTPQPGTSYNYYFDQAVAPADVNVGNAGSGQSWSFTFTKDSTAVYNYLNPANTPYASDFPNATLALQYGTNDAYGYARVDANGVYDIGFAGTFIQAPFSFPPTKFMPDELQRMQFPASVGTSFTDQGYITVTVQNVSIGSALDPLDELTVVSHISKIVEVDGVGTFTINGQTFNNVYRYRITEYRKDSAWATKSPFLNNTLAQTSSDTTITYAWYDPVYKNNRLMIEFSTGTSTNAITSSTTTYSDTTVSFSDDPATGIIFSDIQSIKIYPNPAVNEVMIDAPNVVITAVKAYSVLGQEFTVDFNNKKVDISSLPTGMYILVITDQKGMRYQARIVKE